MRGAGDEAKKTFRTSLGFHLRQQKLLRASPVIPAGSTADPVKWVVETETRERQQASLQLRSSASLDMQERPAAPDFPRLLITSVEHRPGNPTEGSEGLTRRNVSADGLSGKQP